MSGNHRSVARYRRRRGAPPARPGTGASATERLDPQAAQRLIGVAEDLADAVTHGEITAEQAEKFLQQVCERLAA